MFSHYNNTHGHFGHMINTLSNVNREWPFSLLFILNDWFSAFTLYKQHAEQPSARFLFTPRNSSSVSLGQNRRASTRISIITKMFSSSLICLLHFNLLHFISHWDKRILRTYIYLQNLHLLNEHLNILATSMNEWFKTLKNWNFT